MLNAINAKEHLTKTSLEKITNSRKETLAIIFTYTILSPVLNVYSTVYTQRR